MSRSGACGLTSFGRFVQEPVTSNKTDLCFKPCGDSPRFDETKNAHNRWRPKDARPQAPERDIFNVSLMGCNPLFLRIKYYREAADSAEGCGTVN